MGLFTSPQMRSSLTSFGTTVTISANTTTADYDLASDLTTNYDWDGVSAINVVLNVEAGANVYGTTSATPAISVDLVTDSTLIINNQGSIIAHGGAGGGGSGGDAIELIDVSSTINNLATGIIAGGGGGGGSGSPGSGSGSYGPIDEAAPTCQGSCSGPGNAGGSGASSDVPTTNTAGSRGGTWGVAGTSGGAGAACGPPACPRSPGGNGGGGPAGNAITIGSGGSNVYNDSGTTYGASE